MGMGRGYNIIFTILFVLMLILFYAVFSEGSQDSLSLLSKLDSSEDELRDIDLTIGKRKYTYEEERIVYNDQGRITSINKIRLTDSERQIALQLLNLDTGATEIIKITKRGGQLISPHGYEIKVVKRINGIEWNGRNTHFRVVAPLSSIVLKIVWPNEAIRIIEKRAVNKNGKKTVIRRTEKYIENIVYSPYSTDDPNTSSEIEPGIHTPETSSAGAEDLENIFKMACQILGDRGVMSKAFPQYIVCELPFLNLVDYQRLLLIEQMDESEFYLDSLKTVERVFVILRANRQRAFTTCNSSKPSRACGPVQFTDRWRGKNPGTYSTVVRSFPSAKLIKSFPAGAFDHVNSAMAAILLHDLNLKYLVDKLGDKVIQNHSVLVGALAGCYNGNPKWTYLALGEYYSGKINDWVNSKYLRPETRGYLVKHEYLMENDLP